MKFFHTLSVESQSIVHATTELNKQAAEMGLEVVEGCRQHGAHGGQRAGQG